jgi:hypothetical protein
MGDQRWSIGQLARASGVTVRTLHYYDQIGLVSPGERTAAGHRRYVEADVRRLYRVRPAPAPHARRGLRRHRDHVQRWAGLHPPPDPGRATGHTTISYEDVARSPTRTVSTCYPLVAFDAVIHVDKVAPWTSTPG